MRKEVLILVIKKADIPIVGGAVSIGHLRKVLRAVNAHTKIFADKPKKKINKPSVNIPKDYLKFVDGSGDLGNVKDWKVQVQLGNSVGRDEPDVGGWGKVGYVMVSPEEDNIIPIARSDEHRSGWELMQHLQNKKTIKNMKSYFPVYIHGTHVFSGDDKTTAKAVFKWWLDHGGNNIKVEIYQSGSNSNEKFKGTLKDFIDAKSFVPVKGQLSSQGLALINAFRSYAELVKKALENPRLEKAANKAAENILEILAEDRFFCGNDSYKSAKEAIVTGDFATIEGKILGLKGLKNAMHNSLRDFVKNPKNDSFGWFRDYFHDLDEAKKAFDALGNI